MREVEWILSGDIFSFWSRKRLLSNCEKGGVREGWRGLKNNYYKNLKNAIESGESIEGSCK